MNWLGKKSWLSALTTVMLLGVASPLWAPPSIPSLDIDPSRLVLARCADYQNIDYLYKCCLLDKDRDFTEEEARRCKTTCRDEASNPILLSCCMNSEADDFSSADARRCICRYNHRIDRDDPHCCELPFYATRHPEVCPSHDPCPASVTHFTDTSCCRRAVEIDGSFDFVDQMACICDRDPTNAHCCDLVEGFAEAHPKTCPQPTRHPGPDPCAGTAPGSQDHHCCKKNLELGWDGDEQLMACCKAGLFPRRGAPSDRAIACCRHNPNADVEIQRACTRE